MVRLVNYRGAPGNTIITVSHKFFMERYQRYHQEIMRFYSGEPDAICHILTVTFDNKATIYFKHFDQKISN